MNPYVVPGIEAHTPTELEIYKKVCDCYGKSVEESNEMKKRRIRDFVEIRQITMTLIRLHYGNKRSFSSIGSFFGKDHATVLHAFETVRNLRETSPSFRKKTNSFFNNLVWPEKREYR